MLQRASGLMAGAFLPNLQAPPSGGGSLAASSAGMTALSAYMAAARTRPLPGPVLEKVKHHVLDTCAAMISGADLPPGRAAIDFAHAYGGSPIATVAASGQRLGPIEAAMVNGVMAHADETDDSHAPSVWHPGCAVVPAALATGERFAIDGQHFLRSVALGGPKVIVQIGVRDDDVQVLAAPPLNTSPVGNGQITELAGAIVAVA
jgi:hypothetical protein